MKKKNLKIIRLKSKKNYYYKNKRQSDKHFKKQWKSLILKNKVDPENICKTIKYLINNDNITGQIISVDGGQSLAWKTPDIINVKE